MKVTIDRLPEEKWQEYKEIRLEALKNDSTSFGSSYEEEVIKPEEFWRSRIKDVLFALNEDGKIVGLMAFLISSRRKTRHKAELFSVYVRSSYRRQSIGTKMLKAALHLIKQDAAVIKVNLTVGSSQKPAIKLYESIGFRKTGTLHKEVLIDGKFYDEDIMELFL